MVSIGTMAGKKTVAVITDMGSAVGTRRRQFARGPGGDRYPAREGPADFKEVVFALGSQMLMLAGRAADERKPAH